MAKRPKYEKTYSFNSLMVLYGFNLWHPLAPFDTAHALKDTLQLLEYGYADFLAPSQSLTLLLKKSTRGRLNITTNRISVNYTSGI